jgi:hypothetical protein
LIHSGNANNFEPAGFAAGDSNGRARYFENAGKELDRRSIGLAVNRRSCERDFQRIAYYAGDCILFGAWLDLNGKGDVAGSFTDGDQLACLILGMKLQIGNFQFQILYLLSCAPNE